MSDRGYGSDLIPPYKGEPGNGAELSAYLAGAEGLCKDPRHWVSADQWHDLMQQVGAALAEFCELQVVKDDLRMQRLIKSLAFTRDMRELSEAYDELATYVAEVLTKIDASSTTGSGISRQSQTAAGRTRLIL